MIHVMVEVDVESAIYQIAATKLAEKSAIGGDTQIYMRWTRSYWVLYCSSIARLRGCYFLVITYKESISIYYVYSRPRGLEE